MPGEVSSCTCSRWPVGRTRGECTPWRTRSRRFRSTAGRPDAFTRMVRDGPDPVQTSQGGRHAAPAELKGSPMTSTENKNLLQTASVNLLGPDIEHRASLEAMLGDEVGHVSWVPNSYTHWKDRRGAPPSFCSRLVRRALGTTSVDYLNQMTGHIDETDARFVIAYWGTLPLSDLVAVKKRRSRVRVILMALCYPLSLTAFRIQLQHARMRRARRYMDGVIYPSAEMAEYFRDRVFG